MTAERIIARAERVGVRLAVDGDRLRYQAPPGALTPELAALIREHRAGILRALANADGLGLGTEAPSGYAVPTACLAPLVCGVVGICGRDRCIPVDERPAFVAALVAARSPANPHRVPDFAAATEATWY